MHGMIVSQAADLVRLGAERLAAGDTGNAFALLRSALAADVDYAPAYRTLGNMAAAVGRYDVALAMLRRALWIEPKDGKAWNDYGNILWRAQRFAAAEDVLRCALKLRPDHFSAYQNLGLLYYATGRPELAIEYFDHALDLKSDDNLWLKSDKAHATLKAGDLAGGLQQLEVRWNGLLQKNPIWECGIPKWGGQRDNVLLLHAEQGFGDTIQFVRYVPAIRRYFNRVIFAAPKPLIRLLNGQCGIDQVIDIDSPSDIVRAARAASCHCPLISAVAVLEPSYDTIPSASKPYLAAPTKSTRSFREGGTTLAVGLVWAASPGTERSRQRSVSVSALLALGEIPGVRLWSLQFPPYARDRIECGAEYLIEDATATIADFADTAAVLDRLDVIVTVDTAMVHLAGALGRPCLMLNPINPCWRWCKGAAPWYGSVELFDQVDASNWDAPVEHIRQRLIVMANEKRNG